MIFSFPRKLFFSIFICALLYFHTFLYEIPCRNLVNLGEHIENSDLILFSDDLMKNTGSDNVNSIINTAKQECECNSLIRRLNKERMDPTLEELEKIHASYKSFYNEGNFIHSVKNTYRVVYSLINNGSKKTLFQVELNTINDKVKKYYENTILSFYDNKEIFVKDITKIEFINKMKMPTYFYNGREAKVSNKPILFLNKLVNIYTIGLIDDKLEAFYYYSHMVLHQIEESLVYDELYYGKKVDEIYFEDLYYRFCKFLLKKLNVKDYEIHTFENDSKQTASNTKIHQLMGINIVFFYIYYDTDFINIQIMMSQLVK